MSLQPTKLVQLREPTDFSDREFFSALVNVTNVCNLSCKHCFVFRADNPNKPRDKMDDATMLAHLEALRDKHKMKYMLFMGGEPMIRKKLVLEAMKLFERSAIVTYGTYGIPSVPGHLVTVSLDGPEAANDALRGEGVFRKVKEAIFARDVNDGSSMVWEDLREGGNFERTFCCYGNDVDCTRCGAYAVFNSAHHLMEGDWEMGRIHGGQFPPPDTFE